jgi:DNA (cytosine-5)-methyltransferase 1
MGPVPTAASFFAGAGGMDLGFREAGFGIAWAVEKDEWAAETYRRNLGAHVRIADAAALSDKDFPDADVFIGGPPCQPFSTSGNRLGLLDDRGNLFLAMARAARAKRPKAFVIENVKGLLTHDRGRTLGTIVDVLSGLGYRVSHTLLNAWEFGVPQRRERLFVVGTRSDIQGRFEFPTPTGKGRTVEEAIGDLAGREGTLPNHEPMRHTARIVERFKVIASGQSLADVPQEHMQRRRGQPDSISGKIYKQNNQRLKADQPSPTICASFQSNFIHPTEHRNLTAREAARLQGFPDWFVFHGQRTTMSWERRLSQYQQIGNAVPPPLARAVASSVLAYLASAEVKAAA